MAVRSLTPASMALLVVTFAAFGAQQVAVKIAVGDMAPLTQAFWRSVGGAGLLSLWLLARRRNPFSAPAGPSALLGLLFAVDFGLLYIGIGRTSAAHATVVYYTAPMMIALAAMLLIKDEPFSPRKAMGIAVASLGVILVSSAASSATSSATLVGDLLCFAAAVAWAATVLVIRATDLRKVDASVVLFHQLFGSIPLLGLTALAAGEGWNVNWTTPLAASLAFQTVGVAFLGYLVFFAMLRRYPASEVSAMSFLAPLFGVAFAAVILGEGQGKAFWFGAAAIVGGLYLTNRTAQKLPSA